MSERDNDELILFFEWLEQYVGQKSATSSSPMPAYSILFDEQLKVFHKKKSNN